MGPRSIRIFSQQNRRKPSQKSVDVSGVQNRSFTSQKTIHLRFQHPQKMRAPTAPSFTKFHSAYLTRTAESSQNPGAPAGRVLAQNEFPSKTMGVPTARPFTLFISAHLTRTAESSRNRGAGRRALPLNEFRTNRRRQWRLRRESGLFEIERQGPAPGPSVPVYESDVLSNSLKSFGLPLPRLAFMHWPTKKPMTFWFPSRYCCA